jgi:hypothetical protein
MDILRTPRTVRRRSAALALAGFVVGAMLLVPRPPAGALTIDDPAQPVIANATHFDALGSPYGGCGLPQDVLETQHFVALNVYDTPGDYAMYSRPLTGANASKRGMWNNGLNCGRWVQVTIDDFCTGTNDGAAGQEFCRNGSWVSDKYNGATLNMLVADSCGDSNAWCRDDPYHLDLRTGSVNEFLQDGRPVGDMAPDHFNNRHISWKYIPAPGYTGDIQIGFLQGAQTWWAAIAVSHLREGMHDIEYFDGTSWHSGEMNGDMGQSRIIEPLTSGGEDFRIRVRDIHDELLNNGRVYDFSLPSSCSNQCSAAYTEVPYTTTGGTDPTDEPTVEPTEDPTGEPTVEPTGEPTVEPTTEPTTEPTDKQCTATHVLDNSWQGGFQATVTVKNTSKTTFTGWKVTMTNPTGQKISQVWNAKASTTGSVTTATNEDHNTYLSPGTTTTFGYLGSTSGTPQTPTLTCTGN